MERAPRPVESAILARDVDGEGESEGALFPGDELDRPANDAVAAVELVARGGRAVDRRPGDRLAKADVSASSRAWTAAASSLRMPSAKTARCAATWRARAAVPLAWAQTAAVSLGDQASRRPIDQVVSKRSCGGMYRWLRLATVISPKPSRRGHSPPRVTLACSRSASSLFARARGSGRWATASS